eukprot:gb/GECH01010913.1/.p1 GENE.gb/GECH01010913.1/~~gb/GECH01010913.1/.p1  ORF type:complete len:102 (+),score=3.88 gb/GECH01010913.1/:1-306(+)
MIFLTITIYKAPEAGHVISKWKLTKMNLSSSIRLAPIGHRQAPSLLKIGFRKSIARERVHFKRFGNILCNNASCLYCFFDLEKCAEIKFAVYFLMMIVIRV